MEKKAIRVAYGEAIVKLGAENDKVVVLDADLAAATMTNGFKKAYPDRFIDCGIAEANMVDMAAGMSTMGLIPFCSTFAVFAGRSYDQIRNGVCYPKFNVKFGFSHAGITLGEDGGSHQAIEDIALMRVLPNMTVFVPSDATECRAVRPRGCGNQRPGVHPHRSSAFPGVRCAPLHGGQGQRHQGRQGLRDFHLRHHAGALPRSGSAAGGARH